MASNMIKMFEELQKHISQDSISPDDVEKIIASLEEPLKEYVSKCDKDEADHVISSLKLVKDKLVEQREKLAQQISTTPDKFKAIQAYNKKSAANSN